MSPSRPAAGQKVAHYRILEQIHAGGMGIVYKAEDTRLGRTVALKVLPPDRPVTDSDRERFVREARAAAALRHPNICTVHDAGEDAGVSYIAMAYVPGRSLRQLLAEGPLGLERALDVAVQVARGLQAAHDAETIHRDIKSANVILDESGHATVLDFGIAKAKGQTQTGEGATVGTVAYMSPEQAEGSRVDHRTDVWSLGALLYEMLSGRPPFEGDQDAALIYQIVNRDPPSLRGGDSEVPRSVARIVERAMEKKPANRYSSMKEMLEELERVRKDVEAGIASSATDEPAVAVLPFTNLSDEKNQDYFCHGMAEDIITSLSQIEGMRVVSRTSSFAFANVKLDIREIGRKLGVDAVLEGSVRKMGERLRINAQLINVGDGYHLWSERYDRDLRDVFTIQDEIAHSIVEAMKVRISEREKRTLQRVPTTDLEAYDFYIRGRQQFHGLVGKGLGYARNFFTSAIIRDPNFALAYCGLADTYAMIHQYYDSDRTNVENALTASAKALELGPDMAEAHASYGLALSLDERYEEAMKEFDRAIELSPKLFEAYYFYARTLRAAGEAERAAEMFKKAGEVRPEDYQSPLLEADTYRGLNRPDDVARAFARGLAAAERHLELEPDDARALYLGAHAQLSAGKPELAREWMDRSLRLGPRDPAILYNAAGLCCLMGESDRCLEHLEAAVENGFAHLAWVENDPDFDTIRDHPRYRKLLETLRGLK
jgi:serine/threonine protein kinase/tetratricopeptide (TPR) repeat protein